LQTRALDRYLRLLDALPQAARFLKTLRPTREAAVFHLPPADEAKARTRAARFQLLRTNCPVSEFSEGTAASDIHSTAPAVEQLPASEAVR
jgi:hypothetical protein